MTKAVIFYTNGTSHKLSLPKFDLATMNRLVNMNINGYPELTVDHVNIWLER